MFENWVTIVALVGGFALGGVIVFLMRRALTTRRIRAAQGEAESLLEDARTKHKETLLEAKEEAIRIKSQAEVECRERRTEIHRQERRIVLKEENLDK